jgi:hypothetical protein
MARAFFILAILVFLGDATGVVAFVAGAKYSQVCADEELDGQCGPLCLCYTCSAHHRPLTPVERVAVSEQRFLRCVPLQPARAPASPAPYKIFHVPKYSLA